MIGNIWLSSALIITAIFSSSALYKSYSDMQEAKQIQENYEIISDIKTLIAKQYNKNPEEITRDEIIAHLPRGGNWEKVLLLDRNKESNLPNKELVNEEGKLEISVCFTGEINKQMIEKILENKNIEVRKCTI